MISIGAKYTVYAREFMILGFVAAARRDQNTINYLRKVGRT